MKIKISKIRKTLEDILIKKGVSADEAQAIADEYLGGELQGKHSHGLMAFPSLLKKLDGSKEKPEVVKKTHSLLVVDAKEHLGSVVGQQFGDEAVEMARTEGIVMILIKNMTTWLRPGTMAKYVADKGMIGLVFNNGGKPMIAPHGGYDPVVGTNPIGIGIPTSKEPIVADMATSIRAWGEVRKAEATGKDLPKNSYYDDQGEFAVKAKDAHSAAPMGGYKGFTLALLIEILTGSMLGRLMGSQQMNKDYRVMTRGGVIIIINPEMTSDKNEFLQANSALIEEIKSSRKLSGVDEIVIPGERAVGTEKANLEKGELEIRDELWADITGK